MSKHVLIGNVIERPRPNCDVCDRPADVSFDNTKNFFCATHGVEHMKTRGKEKKNDREKRK